MKTTSLWLALAGAVLLCGCGKQTKINSEEIKILSQQMIHLQQTQAKQIAAVQSQLAALGPTLDKMNDLYFEKVREDALFYHTNTLFLILTVNGKIESELQAAAVERQKDHSLAFAYHTNELDLMNFYAAQILDAMNGQEGRIEDQVNAGARQTRADLRDDFTKLESELQAAAAERQKDHSLAFAYHTNELDLMKVYAAQITDAMSGQEGRIEDKVNSDTRQTSADLRNELVKQIKVLAPDETEIARRRQLEADMTQIKRQIEQIQAQLGRMATNVPAARP